MVFSLAAAVALAFAIFTDQRWEDYYITFRVSKHLATGLGLVFQPGERVHVFTSPLGVLLPALISWTTGARSDDLALWIFRLASIGALAGAASSVWRIGKSLGWERFPCAVAAGLVMTDAKSVSFSINGMETGFMLLFLALTVLALVEAGQFSALRLGSCWAALMWTRPDGFVFFGSVALAWLIFIPRSREIGGRRALVLLYLRSGLVCAALYLPWFLWAWHYYGSPVPHPVVAKGLGQLGPWTTLPERLATLPARQARTGLDAVFMPTYFTAFLGWPMSMAYASRALGGIAILAFVVRRLDPVTRCLSFALVPVMFYLLNVEIFPWYMPPAAMLAFIVLAGILDYGLKVGFPPPFIPKAAGVLAILFTASLLFASAWQLRQQQRLVEGQRRKIGIWLGSNKVSPADTVFLEPLGYIGYFSQLKMFDFPGLSSTEVISARRKVGDGYLDLISTLNPRWAVLRPGEVWSGNPKRMTWFSDNYALVKTFDVSSQIAAVRYLPGRSFLEFDQRFLVWKRRD